MRDPKARARAQTAFESLLDASRAPSLPSSAAASSGRRR